jgi:hypothetical protein
MWPYNPYAAWYTPYPTWYPPYTYYGYRPIAPAFVPAPIVFWP